MAREQQWSTNLSSTIVRQLLKIERGPRPVDRPRAVLCEPGHAPCTCKGGICNAPHMCKCHRHGVPQAWVEGINFRLKRTNPQHAGLSLGADVSAPVCICTVVWEGVAVSTCTVGLQWMFMIAGLCAGMSKTPVWRLQHHQTNNVGPGGHGGACGVPAAHQLCVCVGVGVCRRRWWCVRGHSCSPAAPCPTATDTA